MTEIVTVGLMLVGALFMLLAAVGLARMPDLYLRMSATTKAATLGAGSILLGAAIYFSELGASSRAIATIIFLLITAPVAAHMLGRAAFFNGVPLWRDTLYNELRGRYDGQTHKLAGPTQTIQFDDPKKETK
ncbi:MAG: monovalent cation/H(+) antiporter subunit G [Anaerolineae bacterium]|nr:monovalent cation/H(+) antiporter subunit G [Anaerolineae bacterium]